MSTWRAGEYWGIVGSLLVLFVVFLVCMEFLYSRVKAIAMMNDGSPSVKGEEPTSNSQDAA
ncbi:MAG: hypothetical protein ACREJ6_03670 [Candidatus Methylomirabilis sp.]